MSNYKEKKEVVIIENLTKKYFPPGRFKKIIIKSPLKKEVSAVSNVSLKINEGELFGLIGKNGAGKTTLIKILCTLLLPTSGKVYIDGYDVVKEEDKARAAIGFVSSEERSFYWRLSGRQNLKFFASLHGMEPSKVSVRIESLLLMLDLEKAADDMYYSYSSGMKQKLMMARGLLSDPKILFLDEPTKSIDAVTAREFKNFIKDEIVKKQGRTVFLTSHRLEEIEELCDRIAIIDKGSINFIGTIDTLRKIVGLKDKFTLEIANISAAELSSIADVFNMNASIVNGNGSGILTFEFNFKNGQAPISDLLKRILKHDGKIISFSSNQSKLEEMFLSYLVSDPINVD